MAKNLAHSNIQIFDHGSIVSPSRHRKHDVVALTWRNQVLNHSKWLRQRSAIAGNDLKLKAAKPDQRSEPLLRVGGKTRRGLGFQPGTEQIFEMHDGEVSLDTIPVGRVAAVTGSRLVIRYSAEPSFQPSRVWLRVEPR